MIKRMYKTGRPHYPRDVFDTVVRRGVRLNQSSLNTLSGAIQRWVQVGTSITETMYEALVLVSSNGVAYRRRGTVVRLRQSVTRTLGPRCH